MCKVSWTKKSIHSVESANKTSTVKYLQEFCGRKAFHDMESTLCYFPQCEKYNLNFSHCGNVDFPLRRKSHSLSWQKCPKSRMICYAKYVKTHGAFVVECWPEFYARRRFMKYSMSVP